MLWTRILVEELEICFEESTNEFSIRLNLSMRERDNSNLILKHFNLSNWVNRVPFTEMGNARGKPSLERALRVCFWTCSTSDAYGTSK